MVKINSINELKMLLEPLLKYKKNILEKENVFVTEDDIFYYFVNKRWKVSNNLHLCDIVDDVLNIEISDIEVFNK